MSGGDDLPRVDGYTLLESLGEGLGGKVYRARASGSETVVALKLLELPDAAARERARREVEILQLGAHPLIVPLLDADLAGDPPRAVFPLYPGGDLRVRLEEVGTLEEPEAVELGRRIATALAHLHSLDVLHRDLKPENVFLDAERAAFLGDLGLGRAADHATVTRTMELPGTEPYLACELWGGAPATEASDVFALGVVLVEVLTGVRPAVTPDGARLPPEVGERASPRFAALLRDVLHRAPERRPSARELAARLASLQLGPREGGAPPDVQDAETRLPAQPVTEASGPDGDEATREAARGHPSRMTRDALVAGLLVAVLGWVGLRWGAEPLGRVERLGEVVSFGAGGRASLRAPGPEAPRYPEGLEVVIRPASEEAQVLRVPTPGHDVRFILEGGPAGWRLRIRRPRDVLVLAGGPDGALRALEVEAAQGDTEEFRDIPGSTDERPTTRSSTSQ